jgi:hypothetical protein
VRSLLGTVWCCYSDIFPLLIASNIPPSWPNFRHGQLSWIRHTSSRLGRTKLTAAPTRLPTKNTVHVQPLHMYLMGVDQSACRWLLGTLAPGRQGIKRQCVMTVFQLQVRYHNSTSTVSQQYKYGITTVQVRYHNSTVSQQYGITTVRDDDTNAWNIAKSTPDIPMRRGALWFTLSTSLVDSIHCIWLHRHALPVVQPSKQRLHRLL